MSEADTLLMGGTSFPYIEYLPRLGQARGIQISLGTMKAIGAKPWFILSMFLSDAVFIGLIGSTMGITTGIGLAYLLSAFGASGGADSYIAPIFLPNDL